MFAKNFVAYISANTHVGCNMTFPMLPSFLKEFKSELDKYKLEAVRIEADPITRNESLSVKASKFLGKPYLPISRDYPKNKFGKPMILFAQINFEEVPPLKGYPRTGVLQIFTSELFWAYGDEYFLYLYHQDTNQPHQTDFSFLTEDLYADLPISCEHKLKFSKVTEYGGVMDFRFNFTFNRQSPFDFGDELSKEEQDIFADMFCSRGHKIGGYAYFTQGDPKKGEPERKDGVLLLQINTDGKIMFGDAGIGNFFINAQDLKKKRFDKTYFYWDCP